MGKRASRLLQASLVLVLVSNLLLQILWTVLNGSQLRDFGSFVAAGRALADGDNPYGVYEETFRAVFRNEDFDSPNLNPPVSLLLFRPLDDQNPYVGKAVLSFFTLFCFVAVAAALLRHAGRKLTPGLALWLASLAGLWHVLSLGQIYVQLLALLTCAWIVQEKRPVVAGLLVGMVVSMKPGFVLWPALLFLSGERRTSLAALPMVAGLSLLPLAVYGGDVYRQWLQASADYRGLVIPNNASLYSVFSRAGLEEAGMVASLFLLALLAGVVMIVRPSRREVAQIGLIGALVLGPISWVGYSLFALPVLLTRPWHRWERVAAATMIVPVWAVLMAGNLSTVGSFLAGTIYSSGLLVLLAVVVREAFEQAQRRRDQPAHLIANEQAPALAA